MPGIGVISNANARLNKISPILKDSLNFIVGRRGEVISTYTLDNVTSTIQDFKKYEVDIIAISGGDGTSHRTLEKIIEVYDNIDDIPAILLLPSGTQNMVPKSFGITGSSISTMLFTLTQYKHNIPLRVIKRNLLKVNQHYSFMLGLGVAPRFLKLHYTQGKSWLNSMFLVGEIVADVAQKGEQSANLINSLNLEYSYDGKNYVKDPSIHSVFVSFAEEVALRFRIFPRAGWHKNKFESMLINSTAQEAVIALPYLWASSTRDLSGFKRELLSEIHFKLENPEIFTLDGELYNPEKEFHITAGPELKFVVPGFAKLNKQVKIRSEKIGPWNKSFLV